MVHQPQLCKQNVVIWSAGGTTSAWTIAIGMNDETVSLRTCVAWADIESAAELVGSTVRRGVAGRGLTDIIKVI